MPYIEAKISVKLSDEQKNHLQSRLTEVAASALSKPKAYIMACVEDDKSLYMAGGPIEKGAYISISLLGSTTKPACQTLTQDICHILSDNFGIESSHVYVTYHPVDLWGWNNMMF